MGTLMAPWCVGSSKAAKSAHFHGQNAMHHHGVPVPSGATRLRLTQPHIPDHVIWTFVQGPSSKNILRANVETSLHLPPWRLVSPALEAHSKIKKRSTPKSGVTCITTKVFRQGTVSSFFSTRASQRSPRQTLSLYNHTSQSQSLDHHVVLWQSRLLERALQLVSFFSCVVAALSCSMAFIA